MQPGFATPRGTARFASRFAGPSQASFYRAAQDCLVSSLGLGTYLGEMDDAYDRAYTACVLEAARSGMNFFDTSLNYRTQRSERSIGAALQTLFEKSEAARDELVVCTKAGYLVRDAVPKGVLYAEDVVGGMHSMAPAFLEDQLERSRQNLGLETIDVFYLHNPETQLPFVTGEEFYRRAGRAFEALEKLAADNKIRYYGTATWDGYRQGAGKGLSLSEFVRAAEAVAGRGHRFRYIQLPFNLAMTEAYTLRGGGRPSVLEEAAELGITVVASASLLQARLTRGLPEQLAGHLDGPKTDAQRALQFTRSTPGITVALAGMSKLEHVRENVALSEFPPATAEQYEALYSRVG